MEAQLNMSEQEKVRVQNELVRQKEIGNDLNEKKIRLEQELKEKLALVEKREQACKKVGKELMKVIS